MAASMNCLCGRTLKLCMQIYSTSARYNYLLMIRRMSDYSVSQKLTLIVGDKKRQNKDADDFLGIVDDDSHSDSRHTLFTAESDDRFDDHTVSMRSNVKQRNLKNVEIQKKTNFGFVRYDLRKRSVNKSGTLGHIKISENVNKIQSKGNKMSDSSTVDGAVTQSERCSESASIFDTQYFNTAKKEQTDFNNKYTHLNTDTFQQVQDSDELLINQQQFGRESMSADKMPTDFNFIDDQYFESTSTNSYIKHNFEDRVVQEDNNTQNTQTIPDMSYVDDQYFGAPGLPNMSSVISQSQSSAAFSDKHTVGVYDSGFDKNIPVHVDSFNEYANSHQTGYSKRHKCNNVKRNSNVKPRVHLLEMEPVALKEMDESQTFDESRSHTESHKKADPESAYHVAMKIRRELKHQGQTGTKGNVAEADELDDKRRFLGLVDSKGFRILKNQVPHFEHTPSAMIANELKKNIIYNKGDVIAISKPYGLPSHGGPGVRVSVGQLLSQLCDLLSGKENISSLHLIHRLDKETTGVMLLAKTPEMAWRLKSAFRKHEVTKTYWVIVKGIPKPSEGIIDIPMAEASVEGIHRMVLRPEYTEYTKVLEHKRASRTYRAVTRYRILHTEGDTALVECQPLTGVKHQIRVHLSYGLNTPVLGDHKYSHFTKLAPQRLYPEMLQRLGVRQSKVRHMPMHLHAKSIVVPEVVDGQNVIVSCRLPHHFVTNMSRLKLKPPEHS